MKQAGGRFGSRPSPLRLFALIVTGVFAGEVLVMTLLWALLPDLHEFTAVLVDAFLLIVITAPVLW